MPGKIGSIFTFISRTRYRSGEARFLLAAELGVRLALGFALSGASVLGGVAPFAAGFVASSGGGAAGLVSLVGASAGYLIFAPFSAALKYMSVCALIMTAACVFRELDVTRSAWFLPLVAFAATLFASAVTYSSGGYTAAELVLISADGVLCGGSAFFYALALAPWRGRLNFLRDQQTAHTLSVLILAATLLISLARINVFGLFSVGRVLASLFVFAAAYCGGAGTGCAAGVALGLAMDSVFPGASVFGAAYALSGLAGGLFSRKSRFLFTVFYDIVNAAAAAMALGTGAVPAMLYEAFIASVIFMVLPARVMNRLNSLIPERGTSFGLIRAREFTKNRVTQASLAFRELYGSVKYDADSAAGTENPSVIFDRAADISCRRCRRAPECWQSGYQDTVDAMNHVTAKLTECGRIEKSDISARFIEACLAPDEYVAAINAEARALIFRRRLKARLDGSRAIAYRQYSEMSDILENVADELDGGLGFETERESRLRRWLQSQGVSAEAAVFRDRSGRLRAEITGELGMLRRDEKLVDKLSAAVGVRLCAAESRVLSGHMELLEAEPYAASIGVSRMSKKGEKISGDTDSVFKTDDGKLFVVLSDGMGSSEPASRVSTGAVRILERFLRSGVAAESAVRMLNDILLLRNDSETVSATVDLMEVNLFTGDVSILKYGAAPTYIRSGGGVRRIRGSSFAAGLTQPGDAEPDRCKLRLAPGDTAFVVTDGAEEDDISLTERISAFAADAEPSAMTREIAEAAKRAGAVDDVTVVAVRLDLRR
ncbi:MAG: SpoIIE family protein phosphatase [Oscillospiraceae bacterium]|jgi:stage II sporulation protein E|nr:SpoIIE family protein phosphatase [Oscillospiraceae bacterium]